MEPFADLKEGLHDIATWERHRIDFTHDAALRGQCEPPPDIAFAGWRRRLNRLEQLDQLITVLIEHEDEVRALDPRLAPRIAAACPAPSLWPEPAS
jgi:hypothetical protein